MKLLKCTAENFGSYKNLEINLADMGLTLIYGATGSGKSTLPDMASWALFGVTAKDGNVDEIRPWANADEPTTVTLEVETNAGRICVTRIRGKQTDNDLYWTEPSSEELKRGKDLTDTQKLLNQRLGMDQEDFLTSSYFHEFSKTGTFFTANAKERRKVFESISNLQLPSKISKGASEKRKEIKGKITEAQTAFDKETGRQDQLRSAKRDAHISMDKWELARHITVSDFECRAINFESSKQSNLQRLLRASEIWEDKRNSQIEEKCKESENFEKEINKYNYDSNINMVKLQLEAAAKEKCPTCDEPKNTSKLHEQLQKLTALSHKGNTAKLELKNALEALKALQEQVNPNIAKIATIEATENKYKEQLEAERKRVNPHAASLTRCEQNLANSEATLAKAEVTLNSLSHEFDALVSIYDLSYVLRSELLKNCIKTIQDETNKHLEDHFDAEIRVAFTLEGADSLTVNIQKNGYECTYKQLSRGQRAMLRLCFVVSVMGSVSDKTGTHIDNLFFDEVLDGLDSELKIKAFGLFEELSTKHSSIILIDHAPEFQNLFVNSLHVKLVDDNSEVESTC